MNEKCFIKNRNDKILYGENINGITHIYFKTNNLETLNNMLELKGIIGD